MYIVNAGGLQGKRTSPHIIPIIDPPNRNPDASVTQKTTTDQVSKLFKLYIFEAINYCFSIFNN